jgi:hypothetical protein
MISFIGKRARLFLATLLLVGAAFVVFSTHTSAQGGFGYMCDAWEQTCDDGSGDILPGGESGGGGGGGGSAYYCPSSEWCGNFGCHRRSDTDSTQICSQYKIGSGPGTCPSPINCKPAPK